MCINQNHNIPNMATEIVAAHAEGRVRHYNGGQCYIDDNDLSLVIIDHTFGWERSEYPAESEVAKA